MHCRWALRLFSVSWLLWLLIMLRYIWNCEWLSDQSVFFGSLNTGVPWPWFPVDGCPTFTFLHDAAPWWCPPCSFCPKKSFSCQHCLFPSRVSAVGTSRALSVPHTLPRLSATRAGAVPGTYCMPALPGPPCLELKQRRDGQSSGLQNNLKVYKGVFWETE